MHKFFLSTLIIFTNKPHKQRRTIFRKNTTMISHRDAFFDLNNPNRWHMTSLALFLKMRYNSEWQCMEPSVPLADGPRGEGSAALSLVVSVGANATWHKRFTQSSKLRRQWSRGSGWMLCNQFCWDLTICGVILLFRFICFCPLNMWLKFVQMSTVVMYFVMFIILLSQYFTPIRVITAE